MGCTKVLSKKRAKALVLAAVVGATAGVVAAEDLFVQPDKLEVRGGPAILFDPVDHVKKNDRLQSIERTDDGWIKVRTPTAKQGYVYEKSVGPKPASTDSSIAQVDFSGGADAS